MKRLTYALRLEGSGVPDGENVFKISSKSVDGRSDLGDLTFESVVTMHENAPTFDETGTITFAGGSISFSTVGRGIITPAAEEGQLAGAAIWTVTSGTGSLEGATGYVTSNFTTSASDGSAEDHQTGVLFVP